MESKYDYDIIRDYLHGLVDRETARRIRDLIRTDEVARNIAAGILQLEHEFNGNEDEIEAYIEDLRQKQLSLIRSEPKQRQLFSGWMKIAAAIIVIAVVGTVIVLQNSDMLERELIEPYPLSAVERDSREINPGFELYNNREYRRAIGAFGESNDATVVFYKGLSCLYAGDYSQAIDLLRPDVLGASRYQQQAEWYKTLALLKAGRIDEGVKELEKISSNPAHYKSKIARELLSAYEK